MKHPISDQSTTGVKCCMYMFDMIDTAWKRIDRLLISSGIFQGKREWFYLELTMLDFHRFFFRFQFPAVYGMDMVLG